MPKGISKREKKSLWHPLVFQPYYGETGRIPSLLHSRSLRTYIKYVPTVATGPLAWGISGVWLVKMRIFIKYFCSHDYLS